MVIYGIYWLLKVDKIVVFINGCIIEVGIYEELLNYVGSFVEFLIVYFINDKEESDEDFEGRGIFVFCIDFFC